jgi:hypothetical protein
MSAKQATDKLADILDNISGSDRERTRSEPLAPTLESETGGLAPLALSGGTKRAEEAMSQYHYRSKG